MKKPIGIGDRCRVIGGALREHSPNLRKEVLVLEPFYSNLGEHTQLGPVFLCSGKDIVMLAEGGDEVPVGTAHFAAVWLERIDPPGIPDKVITRDLELTQ